MNQLEQMREGRRISFSSPSLRRHALLYGGLIAGATLLTWVVVALVGNDPYHRKTGLLTAIPTAYLIALALLVYRRRTDTEMPFSRGLALGGLTALVGAAGSALALGLFAVVAGHGLLDRHIQELLAMLAHDKAKLLALPSGAIYYPQVVARTRQMTIFDLMLDDFQFRLFIGLIVSLLAAILFRKANPDGSEPERVLRPTE